MEFSLKVFVTAALQGSANLPPPSPPPPLPATLNWISRRKWKDGFVRDTFSVLWFLIYLSWMHHRFSELILARKKIEICTKLKFISELFCFQCLDEKAWKEVRFSAISLLFRDRCQFNRRTAAYIYNCLFLNSNQRARHFLWSAWIAKTRYSLCRGRIVASRCSERVSGRYLFLSVYIKAW